MGDYKMLPLILLGQIAVSIAAPAIQCDLRKITIAGGAYNVTDGTNVGSKVLYTCPEGKYPHPNPSRECLYNGKWSNEKDKFQCRDMECPRVVMMDNGDFFPRKNKYVIGDVVDFECYGGFEMSGSESRTCQANGKWSGTDTKCDDKEGYCPNPGIPPGATKVGTSYKIEDKVTYECEPGLKRFGSKERVCMETKRWSGAPPSCRYWYTYDNPDDVAESFASSLYETAESSNLNKTDEWIQRTIDVTTGGFMNIFIILDASSSLGEENFNMAKEASEVFIDKMANFDFSPAYSVISYATEAKPIVLLSDDESKEAYKVIDRIKEFEYSEHGDKQGTNTRGALAKVYEMLSLQNLRDPVNFLKTKNVILLITDGKHNMGGDPTVEVKRIREILDIKNSKREDYLDIYVFGLGEEISHNEINDIASQKPEQHVFSMESVNDMKKAFDKMLEEAGTLHMCGLLTETFENDKEKVTYPWIAKIIITRNNAQETCKGSVISQDFILTAAHCFELDEKFHTISVDVGGIAYRVKDLHRHDKYDPRGKQDKQVKKSFDYDLALVELTTKITFSKTARPICLPCTEGSSWALRLLGGSVTCIDHEKAILPSELVKAMFIAEESKVKGLERKNVLIKLGSERQACLDDTKKLDNFKNIPDIRDAVTDNFLCTGGIKPQVDPQTCKGDSGGPVIVQIRQRFIQVGVISWGTINSCNGPVRKPGPVPAESRDFHANLFHMLDWLKEKVFELKFL